MKRLAIIGASGHGKVVAEAALLSGWDDIGFFDGRYPQLTQVGPWPVLGSDRAIFQRAGEFDGVVVGIGHNRTRLQLSLALQAAGFPLATILHPAAVVSPHARVGAGSVVLARAVINIDAELGCACIINSGAVVEHDNRLADGVHVSPLAVLAGGVSVGEASWIGAGAAVRQGLKIGHDALVGLGAAAVQDVADGEIVAGVPARILETRSC